MADPETLWLAAVHITLGYIRLDRWAAFLFSFSHVSG
jgi:hypothetical protein